MNKESFLVFQLTVRGGPVLDDGSSLAINIQA